MKKIVLVLITILSFSSFAEVDCLRVMGKNPELKWSKTCNLIVSDDSNKQVESIDACFGKYTNKGKSYIVINSDLIRKEGRFKEDTIIASFLLGDYAEENDEEITGLKSSFSPELFTSYKHTLSYDKVTEVLKIKVQQGLFRVFNLPQWYELTLQCE